MARLKLAQISQTLNKSAKLAFYEDWEKPPPGVNAPVMGGKPTAPAAPADPDDFEYKDTVSLRKKWFGW